MMRASSKPSALKKPTPAAPLNPIALSQLVDAAIFGENLWKLTPDELAKARTTNPYQMMHRVGMEMYRAGERGTRLDPKKIAGMRVVKEEPERAPATDEQPELATAQA